MAKLTTRIGLGLLGVALGFGAFVAVARLTGHHSGRAGAATTGANMTISDCVSIWNGSSNSAVRALTVPPLGPTGTFFAPGGGSTKLVGGQPYQVFVAVATESTSVLDSQPPPSGCFVYFQYPGDAITPPTMLSIRTTADEKSFDLTSAELYHGEENPSLSGLPEAVQAKDGTLSIPSQGTSS